MGYFKDPSFFGYRYTLNKVFVVNPLSTNPTKWLNTLKQFVGKLPTNCLSVFDHFVKLVVTGLRHWSSKNLASFRVCQNLVKNVHFGAFSRVLITVQKHLLVLMHFFKSLKFSIIWTYKKIAPSLFFFFSES